MCATSLLGEFELTSSTILVMDPGYEIRDAQEPYGGCLVKSCRMGSWSVSVLWDKPIAGAWWPPSRVLPRNIVAVEESSNQLVLGTRKWRGLRRDLGQDGGVFALVDFAHFGDRSVIPCDHASLRPHPDFDIEYAWYNFLCTTLGKAQAAIVPHGAIVHWDGEMDVDVLTARKEVVAIRVSISGWPYPYGTEG